MGLLLGFAPFIAFALVDRFVGSTQGLIAGAVVSALLIVRDLTIAKRAPRLLEIGTFVLFGGMAAYAWVAAPDWSLFGVRLRVDLGLLVIAVGSMLVRRPFTLQYARENVEPAHWNSPTFLRTNYVITAVWSLAFFVLVLADMLMLMAPEVSVRVGLWISIAALFAAFKFTGWYPKRARSA